MEHNRPTSHFLDKDDQLPSFSSILHRYDINIYFKIPFNTYYIFRVLKHYLISQKHNSYLPSWSLYCKFCMIFPVFVVKGLRRISLLSLFSCMSLFLPAQTNQWREGGDNGKFPSLLDFHYRQEEHNIFNQKWITFSPFQDRFMGLLA